VNGVPTLRDGELTGERAGYYAGFQGLRSLADALRRPGLSIGFLQNHDQVGNRPKGERTSALMPVARLRVGAALLLAGPLVPMLFQGQEWGASTPFLYFTDLEPAVGRLVSEGRARELASIGWGAEKLPDPQDEATFERSKLCWDELEESLHDELLEWHRQLVGLRHELWGVPARSPAEAEQSSQESVEVICDDRAGWLAVRHGSVTVGCNLGAGPVALPADGELLLCSDPSVRLSGLGLELPPDTVGILAT
jgi:maltooligosyltrehalose trehalohydrolase